MFSVASFSRHWDNSTSVPPPQKKYTYPTASGGMQNGSSVGICTHCTHVLHVWRQFCTLSRCLLTKFLHRSSVGILWRVRCWLGIIVCWSSEGMSEFFFWRFSLKAAQYNEPKFCHSADSWRQGKKNLGNAPPPPSDNYRFPNFFFYLKREKLQNSLM